MESDFNIHEWQAKHFKKTSLNEELTSTTVALEVKRHLETILDIIEQYKEENQLASNESGFDDVETSIEDTLLILGHIE